WITPTLLKENSGILETAKCIVVDLNCPKPALEYLITFTNLQHIPLVVIPVSAPKMNHLPNKLENVDWMIVNQDETEAFFNIKINTDENWKLAVQQWHEAGIKNVIITNGSRGVMHGKEHEKVQHYPAISTPEVMDVTGAGDAFCAAVIHAWIQGNNTD